MQRRMREPAIFDAEVFQHVVAFEVVEMAVPVSRRSKRSLAYRLECCGRVIVRARMKSAHPVAIYQVNHPGFPGDHQSTGLPGFSAPVVMSNACGR